MHEIMQDAPKRNYDWKTLARPEQLPPQGDWRTWLVLAGRGFGKTRLGAETVRSWVWEQGYRHIAIIGETEIETRQVMVEGISGLLASHPVGYRPRYEPSKRQIFWRNEAIATCFSAEAYEQLRGPQFDGAWIDEIAKFHDAEKVWDQLMFSLRIGKNPRVIVTTTPRPLPFLRKLIKDSSVTVTTGSTFDNAQNLAPSFLDHMSERYARTNLGRQELYAEILEDHEGSLWNRNLIEKAQLAYRQTDLVRLVIAVDPAVTFGPESDETGIIVAGRTSEGQGVVLEDLSLRGTPQKWAECVIEAYHRLKADRIVAEVNMGGDLVEQLLRTIDPSISYQSVRATRGKAVRAEPIVALYEQGKIWHAPHLNVLEDQMSTYIPHISQKSPDRIDALVWSLTDLMLGPTFSGKIWSL